MRTSARSTIRLRHGRRASSASFSQPTCRSIGKDDEPSLASEVVRYKERADPRSCRNPCTGASGAGAGERAPAHIARAADARGTLPDRRTARRASLPVSAAVGADHAADGRLCDLQRVSMRIDELLITA